MFWLAHSDPNSDKAVALSGGRRSHPARKTPHNANFMELAVLDKFRAIALAGIERAVTHANQPSAVNSDDIKSLRQGCLDPRARIATSYQIAVH